MTWDEAAKAGVTNIGVWMRLLGYSPESTVLTYAPYVFHPEHVDLSKDWPLAAHERVHWIRQNAAGRTKWVLKYLVSCKFRAVEEMHAHLMDIKTRRWRDIDSGIEDTRRFHKLGCVSSAWMRRWLLDRSNQTVPEKGEE